MTEDEDVFWHYWNLPSEELMKELISGNENTRRDMTYKFWDAPDTIRWFQERGYTLYNRVLEASSEGTSRTVPKLPFDEIVGSDYPYAGYNTTNLQSWKNPRPLCAADYTGKMVYAQDSQQRHVAIKIMLEDSEVYRILRFLSKQSLDTMQQSCIMPVLEVMKYKDGLCFAVMPRWGDSSGGPKPCTTREILDLIHSILKDVKRGNVLVNHYRDNSQIGGGAIQLKLRSEGKLLYALIYFNISIMAPAEANREEYTLPYFKSWDGTSVYQPYDTTQGEYEYNPFIFDVGCMGVVFEDMLQGHERYIPMLAPLIDMMTTRDLRHRFAAAEAHHFVEYIRRPLTEAQLDTERIDVKPSSKMYFDYDRWAVLPQDFQGKWTAYREPPVSASIRALRWE